MAVLLLIAASLFSSLSMFYGAARNYFRTVDGDYAIYIQQEKRLAGIKEMLCGRSIIGYVTDQGSEERTREYYLIQYILAPVVVADDPTLSLVIGNFHHDENARFATQSAKVLKRTDRGLLLLERGESR